MKLKKKLIKKKYIKEKITSTWVNLTNPLHTKWDWDKKIIFLKKMTEKKKTQVKSIKKKLREKIRVYPG
jgi:hypothetical protein